MILVRKHYEEPLTIKSVVITEGSICSSNPQPVQVQAEVQVDEWITIENDVEFD